MGAQLTPLTKKGRTSKRNARLWSRVSAALGFTRRRRRSQFVNRKHQSTVALPDGADSEREPKAHSPKPKA